MDSQQASRHVAAEIEGVGTLMRSLAGRYEGIFIGLAATLRETLAQSGSMAEAARDAAAIAEAAAASFRAHIPNQPATACASGCSPCCHLYVQVPPGSAALIADHVRATFAPAARAALQDRLEIAASAFSDAPDPSRVRLRCVLLGDDNRCTVYEVRPLSCRAFTSRSLPRCQQVVFGDAEGGIEQNAGHFRIHTEATFALEQAAKARGLPTEQKGLVSALLEEMGTERDAR
jgi:Fe-S-cluster containining protein